MTTPQQIVECDHKDLSISISARMSQDANPPSYTNESVSSQSIAQKGEAKEEKEFDFLRFVEDSLDVAPKSKNIINGYIREAQEYFDSKKHSFHTIPSEINDLCLLYVRDTYPKIISDVYCDNNIQTQIGSIRMLRKLSISMMQLGIFESKFEKLIDTEVISKMVSFIKVSSDKTELKHDLQFEVLWVLTNIAGASPNLVSEIVNNGGIEGLLHLLRNTPTPKITDQATLVLGNIASDGRVFRDRILQSGFLKDTTNKLSRLSLEEQRNAIWVISNLFRHRDPLQVSDIDEISQVLCNILRDSKHEDIIADCMWAFWYISRNSGQGIIDYLALQTGIIDECIRLLKREKCKYEMSLAEGNNHKQSLLKMNGKGYEPCSRLIGTVLSENDLTQTVLDAGYLDVIEPWANHSLSNITGVVMWAFSNILAGSHQQIELLLSKDKLIESIISAGMNGILSVKRAACWCICNGFAEATVSQKKRLIEHGAIEVLVEMLKSENIESSLDDLEIVLEGLEDILVIHYDTKMTNPYANIFEELGGLDHLERIQETEGISQDAHDIIVNLLGKYWPI